MADAAEDPAEPGQDTQAAPPPGWAVEQSMDELSEDVPSSAAVTERAWELARAAQQRDDERHDEYDDPDQGGEG
jgi:hypothetical protein